jgi:hypothetical protein
MCSEDLDPLYSPLVGEAGKETGTLKGMGDGFDLGPQDPIAV